MAEGEENGTCRSVTQNLSQCGRFLRLYDYTGAGNITSHGLREIG